MDEDKLDMNKIVCGDINMDPNNTDFRLRRRLIHPGSIEQIVRIHLSEKLKINVLLEVFESMMSELSTFKKTFKAVVDSFSNGSMCTCYFDYDKKNWTGEIKQQEASYCGKLMNFTNILLPNDGFIYSAAYEADPGTNEMKWTSDAANMIVKMASYFPDRFQSADVSVSYMPDAGRCRITFTLGIEVISVNYEYGVYNNYTNHKKYSLLQLKALADIQK
jgi:hypothetical protein